MLLAEIAGAVRVLALNYVLLRKDRRLAHTSYITLALILARTKIIALATTLAGAMPIIRATKNITKKSI
jgi:hypothetical protein